MLITGVVALISESATFNFDVFLPLEMNFIKSPQFLYAGVSTDPLAPSSFGAWLSHAGTQHTGALSFFLVDFFMFFGVALLTAVQASQVCSDLSYQPLINSLITFVAFLHLIIEVSSREFLMSIVSFVHRSILHWQVGHSILEVTERKQNRIES